MTSVGQQDRESSLELALSDQNGKSLWRALRAVFVVDLLLLVVAVLVAWRLRSLVPSGDAPSTAASLTNLHAAPVLILAWIALLVGNDGYSLRDLAEGPEEYRRIGYSSFQTAGATFAACYLFEVSLSRSFLLLFFVGGTALLLLARFAARQTIYAFRRAGRMIHRVVAVGGPSGVNEVVEALKRSAYVGYRVLGACLPSEIAFEPERLPVPVLGSVSDVLTVCEDVGADTVLVARGGFSTASELRRVAWQLEGTSIDLIVVPSLTDVAGPRIHMRPVAGLPLLHVEQPQATEAMGFMKRVFDVLVAATILLLVLPAFVSVALMVKLQDGGPVFFRQQRVGRGGRQFQMVKFRSMVMDAEARLAALQDLNESDAVLFKIREDPRITRVGRYLRRYSIDELPQLLNVLKGEMSLVGPRPPLPSEVAEYESDVHRRLLVRPGLTGLWQVSGRSSLSWDEAIRLDLFYVDNWSMTGDLVILAKTVRAVFGSAGAY